MPRALTRPESRAIVLCALPRPLTRSHRCAQASTSPAKSGARLRQGFFGSNRLACMRHRGGEAAVDRDRLSIDIGRVVSGEKQSHRRPRGATNMSATQARADFARYLKSTDFAKAVVHLPNDTHVLFEHVFGARHFSWRCVKTSVLFSVAAFAIIVVLNVLNHPKGSLSRTLNVLEMFPGFFRSVVAYAIWSIVPDYFNLLKTRKVLGLITVRQINRPSVLVVILVADFLIGYAIFALTFLPMGLFSLHLVLFVLGQVDWNHVVSNFGFDPLPIFSGLEWPFEMLFWPGMVPSIWLWFYVVATLVVRLAVRAAPVSRFSIYFFDIDQHPIRSVGIVAAALVSCVYIVLLAIWKFADLLSETT